MAGTRFMDDFVTEFVGNVVLSMFHLPGGEPFYMVPVVGSIPEHSPYAIQNHEQSSVFGRISKIRFPISPSDVM